MNKIEKRRLLNVAKASREASQPDDFAMARFVNRCGSPACVLGQYASRKDLQRTFTLSRDGLQTKINPRLIGCTDVVICSHFGIDCNQAEMLFCSHGCNNAQTNIQAASYIERFVARH